LLRRILRNSPENFARSKMMFSGKNRGLAGTDMGTLPAPL
jgi:hypothetical protein